MCRDELSFQGFGPHERSRECDNLHGTVADYGSMRMYWKTCFKHWILSCIQKLAEA
jgi:hypothetical protein